MHTRDGAGQPHRACREGRCLGATPLRESDLQIELTLVKANAADPHQLESGPAGMVLLAIEDINVEQRGRSSSPCSSNVPQVSEVSVHTALGAPRGEMAQSGRTIGDVATSRTDDLRLPAVCKVTGGPLSGAHALMQPVVVPHPIGSQDIPIMHE